MTDEEFKACLARLNKATSSIPKDWFRRPGFYLEPCKNCGKCVYVGKCCDNPDSEVKFCD